MPNKIKVLVVEDNQDLRQIMVDYLSMQDDLEIVGAAGDGDEGLRMADELAPDVALLDLIMPNADGFTMLERLQELEGKHPQIIVTSAVGQEEFIRRAIDMGARYYMVKPYDMDILVKRIREVAGGQSVRRGAAQPMMQPMPMSRSMDERITSIFLMIGIPAHIKGYQYLREAVKMVIENKDIINRITKELYPSIARVCNTTPSKVERAIRHAIEVAFSRGRIENINQVFGINIYNKGDKPTNGEFIALVADKLSMERMSA
nr:sporulation transcription factor Spo0A [Maliibacterium massiliense]